MFNAPAMKWQQSLISFASVRVCVCVCLSEILGNAALGILMKCDNNIWPNTLLCLESGNLLYYVLFKSYGPLIMALCDGIRHFVI